MSKTLTLEGAITAADTATALVTQGSVSAPSVVIPAGVTKIDRIVAAVAQDGLAAGGASYILRLGGNAVLMGEQTLVVAAGSTTLPQAGSDQAPAVSYPRIFEDLDIGVRASDTIRVQGEMAGNDLGTARMVVTLVFA